MPTKKTKIIATIGPASNSPEVLEKLILKGVNLFRFNSKHNSLEWHEKTIRTASQVAQKLEKPVGIIFDIQSADHGGIFYEMSGATKARISYIALSYTQSKKDLLKLKKVLEKVGFKAGIIAKIESKSSIDHIEEIIKNSDAVMIARGDLGRETPIEQLAYHQKNIIKDCRRNSTPVIVATQMLESMVTNSTPTRAEATDVANAVLDGADALMLSEETAIGDHPVRVVEEMNKIALFNENRAFESVLYEEDVDNPTELIVGAAQSVVVGSKSIKIDKIVVLTETGYTARVMASFRPKNDVIALTEDKKTLEILTLSFGIIPSDMNLPDNQVFSPTKLIKRLHSKGIVSTGELLLIVHGQHWKREGQTNALALIEV